MVMPTKNLLAGNEKGYIVAFSFGKGAYEEAARVKKEDLEIKLIKVSKLLNKKEPIL
jgi:phosphoserine aminotransferase